MRENIEASPYFWWWYALTLNEEYRRLCERMEGVGEIEIKGKGVRARKLQVYKDFGDVRYTGDKYVAFYNWWRNRVNTNETRGEYLFAEPAIKGKVEVLEDEEAAVEAVRDSERVVISIPLNRQRQYVDRMIDRILKKNSDKIFGRTARGETKF